MNVQPSVLIWTVICFCLFMLVINKLLFKPVLKLMDERRAKVEGARKRAEEAEEQRIEAEHIAAAERELEAARQLEEAQTLLEGRRAEAERELAEFVSQAEEAKLNSAAELSALSAETEGVIEASMDKLAQAFTARLTGGGRQ